MAVVNFYKGTKSQYDALSKDAYTFYLVEEAASKDLYLGEVKLSNAADLAAAITRISTNEADIDKIEQQLTTLAGAETENGSIKKMIKDAVDAVKAEIGSLEDLATTEKGTIVGAINEVLSAVGTEGTNSKVTIDTATTTEGMAKSYTIKQGTQTVGTIDIPKDMVVSAASVETNPEGQEEGTYIVLTIANAAQDKLYINVGTLVDIYTAKQGATQIQLVIDQSTNEISASIVAGSVTATELAENAVITAKIADKNVTKAKLSDEVQTSLGKADSAVQEIAEGTANGTIAVDGTDVAVKGLGSAAYTDSSAYDVAGSANTVKSAVIGNKGDNADSDTINGAKAYADAAAAAVQVEWKTME